MIQPKQIDIVYDNECPVCRTYCTRLKGTEGIDLTLVDARQKSALMDTITARGLDIDEGMVVRIGDRLYYGSEAMHEISKYSKKSGFIGVINQVMFRSRSAAHIFYPIGKAFRNLVLKILGIQKINNLKR